MKAFVYPKAKHTRRSDPGPYKDYSTYKPYLRDEFKGACIYCRMRDSSLDKALFAVEHHLPQTHFPMLITAWTNLYYACRTCNGAKSDFFPSVRHKPYEYVPTPCTDVMFDHLRYRGANVVPHSKTGRFVEELLDLNEPKSVEYRTFFQRILDEARAAVELSENLIADIDAKLARTTGASRTKLQNGRKLAEARLQEDRQHLEYIVGTF